MGECNTTYRSSYAVASSIQSSSGASFGRRVSDLATSITPSFRKSSWKSSSSSLKPSRKSSESSDYLGSDVSLNSVFRGSNTSLSSFRGSNSSINLSSGSRSRRGSISNSEHKKNGNSSNSEVRSRRSSISVSDHKRYGNSTPDINRGWGLKDKEHQGSQGSLNSINGSRSRIPILNRSHGNLLHPDIYGSRCSLRSDMDESCESSSDDNSRRHNYLNADIRRTRYQQHSMYMKKDNRSNPDLRRCRNVSRARLDSDMSRSNDSLYPDVREVYSPVNKRKVLTKQNSVSQNIADMLINQTSQKYLGSDKTRKKWRDVHNINIQSGEKRPSISNVIDQYWNKEDGKYALPYTMAKSRSHSDIIHEMKSEQTWEQKDKRREIRREEKKMRDFERQKIRHKLDKGTALADSDRIRQKVQADLERKRQELDADRDKNNKFKTVGKVINVCKIPRLNKNKFEKDMNSANSICTVRVNVGSKAPPKNKLKNKVRTIENQMDICQRLHDGKRADSKLSAAKSKSPIDEHKSPNVWNIPPQISPCTQLSKHDIYNTSNQSGSVLDLKKGRSFIVDNSSRPNSPLFSRMMHRAKVNDSDFEQSIESDSTQELHSFDRGRNNVTPVDIKSTNLRTSLNNSNNLKSLHFFESSLNSRFIEDDSENVNSEPFGSLTDIQETKIISDDDSVASDGKDEISVAGSVESGIFSHDDDTSEKSTTSSASSEHSNILGKSNDEILNTEPTEPEVLDDVDEHVKALMEEEYELDSFSNIPGVYNADELLLLSDTEDDYDKCDNISFKDLVVSQNDNEPISPINNEYFSQSTYNDDSFLASLPHPGMPGSLDLSGYMEDAEPTTNAAKLIDIINDSLNDSLNEKQDKYHNRKLDSFTRSSTSKSSQDSESGYSTSQIEESYDDSKCDGITRPHVIKCSKNIKSFLKKQPCNHDPSTPGRYSPVTEECLHKHVLLESFASGKGEDDSSYMEPIRLSPTLRKRKKRSKKSKDNKKENLKKSDSKSQEKNVNIKDENPWFIKKLFKNMFCTTPVTVGVSRDDSEPDPLPPPIPPHGVEPGRLPSYDTISTGSGDTAVSSATEAEPTVNNTAPAVSPAPEPMTPDEAQRLLSAKAGLLSDAEAHEVALLLSPGQDSPKSSQNSAPPPVPPHYADAAPPVPPHYGPEGDEYDSRQASHFDPTLASPLSPEDAPSTPDSDISGDVLHVARVKEVLVEDGIHYLEDGHFWVEVPGLPENDEDDEFEPDLPYHAHTKLSFSQHPMQMFSTYSVSEYDRKNEDVDPVAASAEYELEKRVEKMDIFPVDIVKGDGGLGLSIIGMGVGADAGVEKLGIFVKTITSAGATERDGRIQVNDQIIEVDGKSLVGVTQVFAASVLKNTSGRVHFLIGREKDPDNSEVALLIKQSLQADREREERRRALGGPEYDPRIGQGLFDPLSSPSEENSRSEEASSVQHNYASYMDAGGSGSPTSPDAMSPPPEVFDMEGGDTDDTSPDNDTALLRLKLKEGQYKNAMAEAEITKLKMKLATIESQLLEQSESSAELMELHSKVRTAEEKLQSKLAETSTYQDMLEQSQGQFIVLEKKYYKAKKIIKEYQGRERDFLHREEYHITQLEEKDSHYNNLVKALKDRVIQLEGDLMETQKTAGLPVGTPQDTTSAHQLLYHHQHHHHHQQPKPPPATPPQHLETEISDTENSDSANADDEKANTVERKVAVKEELDQAVPPHELLDVSASRAKGELGMRGGLAGRHLPSLKKATSISSTSSQEQSIDEGSMEDDLPEALKSSALEAPVYEGQEQQENLSRIPVAAMQSPASPNQPPWMPTQPPPPYSQATQATTPTGAPPPYHPPPQQFATPIRPPHRTSDSPTSLPSRLHMGSEHFDPMRPEIPYRHPPPVAWVQPVNRAEISESSSMVQQQQHHLTAGRTPQQQSLAEQLKQLLAERETDGISQTPVKGQPDQCVRISRDASPSKPLPNSLIEDVRQAVIQADVSSTSLLGRKPIISGPVHLGSSTAHVVPTGQMVAQTAASPPQRGSANSSAVYSPGRESTTSPGSPRQGRSMVHGSSGVSANPAGIVLLSQRPIDQQQKMASGVDVGSGGELSSGPGSLGSGDEGSGASLGSQSSLCYPMQTTTERSKKSHMWQTAAVTDWTKEQVCQWLVVQGLEGCVGKFQSGGITGPRLLNLDARDLKNLALTSEEKNKIKRKVKELRLAVEKERKQVEKEKKEREKLMKKAEKLAKEAEKKKK